MSDLSSADSARAHELAVAESKSHIENVTTLDRKTEGGTAWDHECGTSRVRPRTVPLMPGTFVTFSVPSSIPTLAGYQGCLRTCDGSRNTAVSFMLETQ